MKNIKETIDEDLKQEVHEELIEKVHRKVLFEFVEELSKGHMSYFAPEDESSIDKFIMNEMKDRMGDLKNPEEKL